MTITMDGIPYRLRVKLGTLRRSFRIEESERSGMVKSGEEFRDIIGTYYDYAMDVEPDPAAPEDYDAFFEAVSALCTVGLSMGATSHLDEVGKLIIIATMFCGRVGPLAIFSLVCAQSDEGQRAEYPAEDLPLA